MTNNVTLTIDNRVVSVPAGTLVVDAAKRVDIDIPVFCYHPKMEPVGMCRMCLVEIGRPLFDRSSRQPVLDEEGNQKISFGPKLETACTVAVSEGMVVRGFTPEVREARDEIIEFILTSHPLDCPICDKGGECPLQNLTMDHGPGQSRFLYDEKINLAKHVPLGELIYLDRERCIQCARCTRFQSEIAGDPVIGFFNRGRRLEIITFSEPGFDSYWSGNTTDICPVGALTTSDFRFGARPWDLNSAASICNQCPVGCNITLNTRREAKSGGGFAIKRVMPRQNEYVNETWICDKGRFSAYQFSESESRLTQPLVRKEGTLAPTSWEEALDRAAKGFQAAADGLLTIASGRLSNEDLYNLRCLSEHLGGQYRLDTHMAGGDLVSRLGCGPGSNLGHLGKGDAVLVAACDLHEEAPIWWLRVKQAAERGASLILVNPRRTRLDEYATHNVRYAYGGAAAAVRNLGGEAGQIFQQAENAIVFFGSEGTDLAASADLAAACAQLLEKRGHTPGRANNGLIPVWGRANDQGAWELGFRPLEKLDVAGALYIVAADPAGDNPALQEALRSADFVVVQELFLTETASHADVVLPAQAYVEREGSYTSGERRAQRFYTSVPALPGTRADFAIIAQIAARLDLELEARIPGRIFAQMGQRAAVYQDLSYLDLSRVEEQWPIVGRGDMYYGGTTYENSQGLGVQLAPGGSEETWKSQSAGSPSQDGLLAVPVTRLYDQGSIVARSEILRPRLQRPHVVMNPADAAELGLGSGRSVRVAINGASAEVAARVSPTVPAGAVLVPRSMGLPIDGPRRVLIEPLD